MKKNILFLGICFGQSKYRTMAETINETCHFIKLTEKNELIRCMLTVATKFVIKSMVTLPDKIFFDHDTEQKIRYYENINSLLLKKNEYLSLIEETQSLSEEIIPNLYKEQKELLKKYMKQDCDAKNLYNQILYKYNTIKDLITTVKENESLIADYTDRLLEIIVIKNPIIFVKFIINIYFDTNQSNIP